MSVKAFCELEVSLSHLYKVCQSLAMTGHCWPQSTHIPMTSCTMQLLLGICGVSMELLVWEVY